jgi:molecular chaperone IbpA
MVATRSISWPNSNFVGFDRLWNELDRHLTAGVDQTSAFPKHNVVKDDDEHYHIELALAGYSQDDLTVEVKDGSLTVSGDKAEDAEVNYIHKGISSKKFSRTFRLNENVVVSDANFVDGILRIDLQLVIPEERKARTLEIGSSKPALVQK